jgi:hypothetical protein
MKQPESILLNLLNSTFNKSTVSNIETNYLNTLKDVPNWTCYSDYCLDNKKKPNNVITFTLIPYIDEYYNVERFIKTYAKRDIKQTKKIDKIFIEFLKSYPLINFSFILNDRNKLFGSNYSIQKSKLLIEYNFIIEQYNFWIKNQPEKQLYYDSQIKKIKKCILDITLNKKFQIYIDIILISFLGSYVSSIIVDRVNNLKVFGWFPDRDKTNDICDGIILNLFHNNLQGHLKETNFQFVGSIANCTFEIFYDHFIKIPDCIAGDFG